MTTKICISLGHMTFDYLRCEVIRWRAAAERFCDDSALRDLDQQIATFLSPQPATDDAPLSHRDEVRSGMALIRDIHLMVLDARLSELEQRCHQRRAPSNSPAIRNAC